MHRVFVSYHHRLDQAYKDELIRLNNLNRWFEDYSVNSGEINDAGMSDEAIRIRVRDEYLRGSTVTIVLVGLETRLRKHVDWELYSSMRDSPLNKQSGIVLVPLPETKMDLGHVSHGDIEKKGIYPDVDSWVSNSRSDYLKTYPYFSERMIDNLDNSKAVISVVPWQRLMADVSRIPLVIELAYRDRSVSEYDLSTPMRRKDG